MYFSSCLFSFSLLVTLPRRHIRTEKEVRNNLTNKRAPLADEEQELASVFCLLLLRRLTTTALLYFRNSRRWTEVSSLHGTEEIGVVQISSSIVSDHCCTFPMVPMYTVTRVCTYIIGDECSRCLSTSLSLSSLSAQAHVYECARAHWKRGSVGLSHAAAAGLDRATLEGFSGSGIIWRVGEDSTAAAAGPSGQQLHGQTSRRAVFRPEGGLLHSLPSTESQALLLARST